MSRQIVNTNGHGRAQATARIFTIVAIVLAVAVLLIFYGLSKTTAGQQSDAAMMQSTSGADPSAMQGVSPSTAGTAGGSAPSAMNAPPAAAK